MKTLKRLFVGSIILLMLTTSLLVTAGVNEKIDTVNMSVDIDNYLGDLKVVHQPWLKSGPAIDIVNYTPPEDNPTFQYYFPEDENGYVDMNFSLNITHNTNVPNMPYFGKLIWPDEYRSTVVNLWINYEGNDHIIKLDSMNCNKSFPETYTIYLKDGEPLKTDNVPKQCVFYWSVWPGIGPNEGLHEYIMPLFPLFMTGLQEDSVDIFINPTH